MCHLSFIQDNTRLIEEINVLRQELKTSQHHVKEVECLLGLNAKKLTPSEARKKLQSALESHEEITAFYEAKVMVR